MWKLWKSPLETRVRLLEAQAKAQDLEIEKLYSFVRSQAGRVDRKKALMDQANGIDLLSPEAIVRAAAGRHG